MMTDQQVKMLFQNRSVMTVELASAKAGMCERTARKYLKERRLPSQMKQPHRWRTRHNPFEAHWQEVVQMLQGDTSLEAKMIFEYLNHKYPNTYQEGQLRTLQRHIKSWKIREGQPKEVMFEQTYHPGQEAQSDFTEMNALEITINNQPFPHLLYHFVMAYSKWEWVSICQSETFEALSQGVQDALWQLGKVPQVHKTDNLSAAVKDLNGRKAFTDRYKSLMDHYRLGMTRNHPGRANENGIVEQAHFQLVRALKTGLLIRGHRNFESIEAYQAFLEEILTRRNRLRTDKLEAELSVMRPLPSKRIQDYSETEVKVSDYGTVTIRRNAYSIMSAFIGEKLKAHIYESRIEFFHQNRRILEVPRLSGRNKADINYRHVIDSMLKKPGAFQNYKHRQAMFPTLTFRATYDRLMSSSDTLKADKEYLQILNLAAKKGESLVEQVCHNMLYSGQKLSAQSVEKLLEHPPESDQNPTVASCQISEYNALLGGWDES